MAFNRFNHLARISLVAVLGFAGTAPMFYTVPADAAAKPAAPQKSTQNPSDLQSIADRAEADAAAARKQADKAQATAASAQANLRTAESNLAAIRAAGSSAAITVPTAPTIANPSVESARSQLQAAQAAEQQAQIRASASAFNPGPANSTQSIFNNMAQTDLQNAHQAVVTAQQNLDAAQRSAAFAPQAPAARATVSAGTLAQAERAVETARRLAASAQKAADAAERNAQTLAERADQARAAARAGAKG